MGDPSEKVRKLAEDALSRLSAELEAGRSDALKNYLAAMGRFHRYSWGNVLLINSQRPGASQVAGFHAWHRLGRFVKAREKGIMILAPMMVKQTEPAKAATDPKSKQPIRLTGFRTAYVFDVSQTDGRPLPEFASAKGDPKDYGDKLRAIVEKRGIVVEHDSTIAPALGVSTGGTIRLIPGLSPSEEFSVLAHELAHEMMHHNPSAASLPKVVRETQAEAVAYVVSRAVGLETNTAAADYIALYNGDKKTLADSLAVIQETSAKILHDLLPEERSAPLPKKSTEPAGERVAEQGEPRSRESNSPEPANPGPEESISLDR